MNFAGAHIARSGALRGSFGAFGINLMVASGSGAGCRRFSGVDGLRYGASEGNANKSAASSIEREIEIIAVLSKLGCPLVLCGAAYETRRAFIGCGFRWLLGAMRPERSASAGLNSMSGRTLRGPRWLRQSDVGQRSWVPSIFRRRRPALRC